MAPFLAAVTAADWEQVAGDIETGLWRDGVAAGITPALFALVSGAQVVVVCGDGARYLVVPPPDLAVGNMVTGVAVRIFLVRTGERHWDGTEITGAAAGPREGHGGPAGAADAEDRRWGYALARALAGHAVVTGAMVMAVTRLFTYLSDQFGTTDVAEAFFGAGGPAGHAAYVALFELLSRDTPPGRRGVLVAR